ncbi:hypothetical protein GNS69_15250 [Vibrio cholerae]|nr:hypothetical protein [Vibrio cholerae]EGQ8661823.1 hypothetical protein [Vibrio cholerae]MEB5553822.1 hypothetical protein [Vibrio cholerae]
MAKEKTVISKAPMRIAFAILLSPLIIFLLAQPLWAPLVERENYKLIQKRK